MDCDLQEGLELLVVVVNFRTPQLVTNCLQTLLPQIQRLNGEVVVVDNCSADGSPERIASWLSDHDPSRIVSLIRSEVNLGFSGGNNIGIRAKNAKYYLLLNSDALVRPGAISILLESAKRNSSFGLISPRLEWPDGSGQESCFRFHSPVSEFLGSAKTGFLDTAFNRFVVALPVRDHLQYPSWTSFACVLIKHEVFDEIGLLDEGFFMYFEDAEFCHRARKAGWEVLHNPQAHVVHLRGGSSSVKENTRLKKRLPRYYYESRARFFCIVYGRGGFVVANVLWTLGRCVSGLRQALGRSDKASVERQWADIWVKPVATGSRSLHGGADDV